MSIFNKSAISKTNNSASTHPWAKKIKEHYANKIKNAHNSVKNVGYPRPKEKISNQDRVTFTVIGNRVTKEFIYCVKLVQGMHRYRWKHYDTPVIKGYTGVEWPKIWRDLKIRYDSVPHCIESPVAVLCDGEYIGGENELRDLIESKYVYHLVLNYQKESLSFFSNYIKSSGRPCVYMHISIDEKPIGSLIFMLYSDVVPVTCENFLRLCQSKKGGYNGSPIHRVVKDGWIQCGGYGLKNASMDCENFIVPHDRRGVLGMANAGRHIECSTQFYVLLQPNEWLKYRFVAFGQLIDGEETLKKIEAVDTYYEAPSANITIYSAGILNLDCQDIRINKSALEYLDGHIEDLVSLEEMFYELLMMKVWLEIEFRTIQKLSPFEGEVEGDYDEAFEETVDGGGVLTPKHVVATRRFIHKHTDIIQLNTQMTSSYSGSNVNSHEKDNNDFDVEEYEYGQEETYTYTQITPALVTKSTKPYFIPLTDKPYPGEVDSNFDLKKLLQGDYCLKSDLDPKQRKKPLNKFEHEQKMNALLAIMSTQENSEDSIENKSSLESIDSEETRDISTYLSLNKEKVSLCGQTIKYISKQNFKMPPLERKIPREVITDEELRLMRMALKDLKLTSNKVSLNSLNDDTSSKQIVRRQTSYLQPFESKRLYMLEHGNEMEEEEEKAISEKKQKRVSINVETRKPPHRIQRRQTQFVKSSELRKIIAAQDEEPQEEEESSKKPHDITGKKKYKLATSNSDLQLNTTWLRKESIRLDENTNIKKERTDSDQTELTRSERKWNRGTAIPSITVTEYRKMNDERNEAIKRQSEIKEPELFKGSLRLPGDTPLYSPTISVSLTNQTINGK